MSSVISNLNFRRLIEYIRKKLESEYILVRADEVYTDLYGKETIMNPNGMEEETPIIRKNVPASEIFGGFDVPIAHQVIAVEINPFFQPSEPTTNTAFKNCRVYKSPEGQEKFKAGVMRGLFFHPAVNGEDDPSLDTRVRITTDYILHDREDLLAIFNGMSEKELKAYLTAVYNIFANPYYMSDEAIELSKEIYRLMKNRVCRVLRRKR